MEHSEDKDFEDPLPGYDDDNVDGCESILETPFCVLVVEEHPSFFRWSVSVRDVPAPAALSAC